jgi:hypothetical protein
MISIIICSKSNERLLRIEKNIQQTIGCEFELIGIDNSENKYSIFSAYNEGISISHFPYLCFLHEDVEIETECWGEKLIKHLNIPNTGLIGVAGGQAVLNVPYDWSSLNAFCNITHIYSDKNGKKVQVKKILPKNNSLNSKPVVALDGVFLAARKKIFNPIRFDENIGGFHCYDLDISIQSHLIGFENRVIYDIDLIHFSRGKFDSIYLKVLLQVHEKWKKNLPLFEKSITLKTIQTIHKNAEKRNLQRLTKRMVRTGLKNKELIPILKTYIQLIYNNFSTIKLLFLPFELNIIRIISKWRKVMIYQRFPEKPASRKIGIQ